jgi:response regulator RpfG family c-di-GMP phosphodiesterase
MQSESSPGTLDSPGEAAGGSGSEYHLHEESPRILVVDDEKMIREILADFLSMEGFWVRTAEDGSAALVELSRTHYDLVLTDLKMPNMGGLELLAAIQKHTPNVVTVIMTGFGTVETAIDAMKRGAYDYILKPFKVEEVVHTIRRGLEKQKLHAENLRLREALSLYKVSEAISASLSLDEVLRTVIDASIHEVDADAVIILLDDGSGGFFERARVLSDTWAEQAVDRATGAPIDPETLGALDVAALGEYFAEDKPLRVHGTKGLHYFSREPVGARLSSLIVSNLRVRGKTIGFLASLSFTRGKKFDEGQRKLLSIVSGRAAAAIENAKLYEDLQLTFRQTIRGLASAIDKMDRYTSGHSERVAAYAQILAIKLGLDEAHVEIVRQSALMHDVGKIGCVLNLNKPGKLSQEDYEIFKKHPGFGKDILEPITFLQPLIPGVHLHHERWDGRGYPLGMKAQEIPLIARIISVADTYDAMTSDRAYRRALPHEVAANEVSRCAGSQFDPDLAHDFNAAIEAWRSERVERGEIIPE